MPRARYSLLTLHFIAMSLSSSQLYLRPVRRIAQSNRIGNKHESMISQPIPNKPGAKQKAQFDDPLKTQRFEEVEKTFRFQPIVKQNSE